MNFKIKLLPDRLITNSCFATANAEKWVSPRHFSDFLTASTGHALREDGQCPVSDITVFDAGENNVRSRRDGSIDDEACPQASEDNESFAANLTHHELVRFLMSSPMVIRCSGFPSSPSSDVFEIYPNVHVFMNLYLCHKHYNKMTFPKFQIISIHMCRSL
jgi:hypothetical protein